MKIESLIFATQNQHKLQEIAVMLGNQFQLKTPADFSLTEQIPETGLTLTENALQKARYVYKKLGINCFADDTGLEVEALNNEPGVYSARYGGPERSSIKNIELLLRNLSEKENRSACFKTVIALILNGEEILFEGKVAGTITHELTGRSGFGYDPVFRPNGHSLTFAEMSPIEKNAISHRALAFAQLLKFLKGQ